MLNNLNVMEWSLNLRSDKETKPYVNFNQEIQELCTRPDVIFLMETVKNNEFEIDGYQQIIESENINGNTTTIAIRTELLKNGDIEIINALGRIPEIAFCNSPNFVQVDIKIDEKIYNLIAVRIRINSNDSSINEYLQRRKQLEVFMNYVSTLYNPIIMGDFNHGRILGDEGCSALEIKNNSAFNDRVQVIANYHYQAIRESFAEKSLALHTPKTSVSCGVKFVDGMPNLQEDPDWNYKIDHLIVNPQKVKIENITYDWNFLFNAIKDGIAIFDFNYRNSKKSYKKGFPDHAMLLAELKLRQRDEEGGGNDGLRMRF